LKDCQKNSRKMWLPNSLVTTGQYCCTTRKKVVAAQLTSHRLYDEGKAEYCMPTH